MSVSLTLVGTFDGTFANEFAITRHPDPDGPHLLSARRHGNNVHFSYWDFLDDGGLFESPVESKPGGLSLAFASYGDKQAVAIHRKGDETQLRVEAYDTGSFWSLDDDQVWTNDTQPRIVTFGAKATPVMAAAIRPGKRFGLAAPRPAPPPPPGGGTTAPGSGPGTAKPPKGKVTIAGTAGTSIGPKVGRAVVASITPAQELRLTYWGFDAGGQIHTVVSKWAESMGGSAKSVSLAAVKELWSADGKHPTGLEFVTAACDNADKLRLRHWRLALGGQGVAPAFTMLSEVVAPETITRVACCVVDGLGGKHVVTAISMAGTPGTLKVIAWKVEASGALTRVADATGEGTTALDAAHVRGRVFVTATRKPSGRFQANYWLLPNVPGGSITMVGEVEHDDIEGWVKCIHVPGTAQHLGDTVFITKGLDGKLQLRRYEVMD